MLLILGTRGIPAAHGGFETFAERFALHMVECGWTVWVYCQLEVTVGSALEGHLQVDSWRGVNRVSISVAGSGPRSTLVFDWRCVLHARKLDGVRLVLGYNTAFLLPLLHTRGCPVLTNMDGIEWKRGKWPLPLKVWFFVNEWLACALSTELVADHPEIHARLAKRCRVHKITTIPYGADRIDDASAAILEQYGVQPNRFLLTVARIEPENSTLELIRAFSRCQRPFSMLCIGPLDAQRNSYHRKVQAAASSQVDFPGAIHDKQTVASLRRHALAYLHGHTVGGTNPSLVEALGAGSAVIAHRNRFNTWTAGPEQFFFSTEGECDEILRGLTIEPGQVERARLAARRRHQSHFTWDGVLGAYASLCARLSKRRAAILLLALAAVFAQPRPGHAEYLLGAGDKLEITLSGSLVRRAAVNADGQIAMPQIGYVTLAGLSLLQAQARLRGEYRRKGILQNADVLLEVLEYRPFYIDGDVARPGAYAYQPNMTVREAVALAGGLDMVRFRFGENPFIRAADLRSEYETLALERLRLTLRQERVGAELDGRPDIAFDPEKIGPVQPSVFDELLESERQQLRQHQANHHAEVTALHASIKEAQENLNALTSQASAEIEGSKKAEEYAALTRANIARGIAPQVRLAEVQRDLTNAQSRYLATEAESWTAARTLSEFRRQLARTEEARRTALLQEAEEATVALQKLESQIKAAAEKFAAVGGARSALYLQPGEEADATIFRTNNGVVDRKEVTSDAAVFASDVVEIRLRPGRLLGLAAVPLARN